MDFDLGESENELCGKIREVLGPDPGGTAARKAGAAAGLARDAALGFLRSLGGIGYLRLGLDNGRNSVGLVAAQECLAAMAPSLFLSVEVSTRIFGRLLAVYGTEEQRAQILGPLMEGEFIGAVGLSEGGMNMENQPFSTEGVPARDGLQVSGAKFHVVNGPIADCFAVAGRTEGKNAFFLAGRGMRGLIVGERFSTLGLEGAPISALTLENCPVASDRVIGPFEEKSPFETLRMWEDQVLAAAGLGVMKRSFEAALDHAKSHRSGGKPVIAYQEVGFKLAEMLTLLQTGQLLAYRAAWMSETGQGEAGVLAHCAKVFCSESAEKVASHALQVLGGHGYLRGNPAEEGYRDAKYLQIAGTSTEISRVKIGNRVMERE